MVRKTMSSPAESSLAGILKYFLLKGVKDILNGFLKSSQGVIPTQQHMTLSSAVCAVFDFTGIS